MRVSAAYEQRSVAVTLSLHETALVGFVQYSPSSRHILACFPRTVPVVLRETKMLETQREKGGGLVADGAVQSLPCQMTSSKIPIWEGKKPT